MTDNSVQNSILHSIKEQIGSNGDKGWPVAVRDRISYPSSKELRITDSNIALTFLWTMRDSVLPLLNTEKIALASNFYTPAGLVGMVRNILANPYIRYIIILGEEYSSKSEDDKISELTSANAIRKFFEKGVDENRKLPGFENSVIFDKNIPVEMINKVRDNVELIDLNKKMPGASMQDKIEEANRLIRTLEIKSPFLDAPVTFDYEQSTASFPYEGGPLDVHGDNIPDTWIKVIDNIYRYGVESLMDANTDRWIKEINPMVAVIHNPQDMDLSINPFLVPLTIEKIEAYKKEILSPLLPSGKAYTYGNKLRAYFYPDAPHIQELVKTTEFKDFEFGQGAHLDKNVSYIGNVCEIDQLNDIIDALNRNKLGKWAIAITWHPADELMRKHKSSPCLVLIHAITQDDRLNLIVYFRSHDMAQGWPENAYGCAAIQKYLADGIGLPTGILTIISSSAHIYSHYYQQVEQMLQKFKTTKLDFKDSRGNYLIEINDGKILVTHVHPETAVELATYQGTTAKELYSQISQKSSIDTSHALYLGSELMAAQIALQENKPYSQDSHTKN